MNNKCLSVLLLVFMTISVQGQVNIRDSSIHLTILNTTYRGLLTGGDMADRFGLSHTIGADIGHKFPNNFYIKGGFGLLLGGPVREDSMLRFLEAAPRLFINDNGELTGVRLLQQGYVIPVGIGKIFSVIPGQNPNCGLFVELGGQFIQHKIQARISEGTMVALSSQNKKGYDRLTNGFGIRESVGYKYFSNSGFLNFSIGLDISQNFTQSRRSINIDTGVSDTTNRLDHLVGISASWILLIYNKAPNTIYFN
ncbi:hypothetical protein N9933_01425 [bacterium]|nr:hypothetical protein [bacterium]